MPGKPLRILAEIIQPPAGAFQRRADVRKRRTMAGDNAIDGQATKVFQSGARAGEPAVLPLQFREDQAKTVLPQGVTRNQEALFRAVIGQRIHVMPRGRQCPPGQPPHLDLGTGRDQAVVGKRRSTLPQRRQHQSVCIPTGHGRCGTGRNGDAAAMFCLQCSIAAHMIGMGVSNEQSPQLAAIQPLPQQRQRLCSMAVVATIHQRGPLALEKEDIVRRQPATLEHPHAGWQGIAHAVSLSSSAATLPSGGRPQPMH